MTLELISGRDDLQLSNDLFAKLTLVHARLAHAEDEIGGATELLRRRSAGVPVEAEAMPTGGVILRGASRIAGRSLGRRRRS